MKKQKIYKHFCIQPYQANFTKVNFGEYVEALDSFLAMEGKLIENFKWQKYFADMGDYDAYQFDEFYDVIKCWAISDENTTLNY